MLLLLLLSYLSFHAVFINVEKSVVLHYKNYSISKLLLLNVLFILCNFSRIFSFIGCFWGKERVLRVAENSGEI